MYTGPFLIPPLNKNTTTKFSYRKYYSTVVISKESRSTFCLSPMKTAALRSHLQSRANSSQQTDASKGPKSEFLDIVGLVSTNPKSTPEA